MFSFWSNEYEEKIPSWLVDFYILIACILFFILYWLNDNFSIYFHVTFIFNEIIN